RAIPPPDIHKIRRQVTQSFSKAPRFSAMNRKKARIARIRAVPGTLLLPRCAHGNHQTLRASRSSRGRGFFVARRQ
ncbi:hypothetical protein ACGYWH_03020, partial [Burkholderia pseudomallei]|uniref:hypothetical protein n=1 Tax=Burkholderia pseudomallei TaxID=28450 RepID=UPI001C4D7424